MTVTTQSLAPGALEFHVAGKLDENDYDEINRETEKRLEHMNKLSLMFRVDSFQGWTTRGLFEDAKFDVKHFTDVSRVAIVAKEQDKKWMATVSQPFTAADVKFFEQSRIEDARAWLTSTAQ